MILLQCKCCTHDKAEALQASDEFNECFCPVCDASWVSKRYQRSRLDWVIT